MNLIDSNIDLSQFTEPENVHQVRDASCFKKRTLDILNHKNQAIGIPMPWAKTRDLIELRPGELSIWTGFKGHGKSMLLSQVMHALHATESARPDHLARIQAGRSPCSQVPPGIWIKLPAAIVR